MRPSIAITPLVAVAAVLGCNRPTRHTETASPIETRKDGLAPPVSLEFDGLPLEYVSPFLGDIDGDGRPDLLMGGDHTGRLCVYRNVGTPTQLRLSGPQWFDDRVPTGRVPKG